MFEYAPDQHGGMLKELSKLTDNWIVNLHEYNRIISENIEHTIEHEKKFYEKFPELKQKTEKSKELIYDNDEFQIINDFLISLLKNNILCSKEYINMFKKEVEHRHYQNSPEDYEKFLFETKLPLYMGYKTQPNILEVFSENAKQSEDIKNDEEKENFIEELRYNAELYELMSLQLTKYVMKHKKNYPSKRTIEKEFNVDKDYFDGFYREYENKIDDLIRARINTLEYLNENVKKSYSELAKNFYALPVSCNLRKKAPCFTMGGTPPIAEHIRR